MKKVVLVFGLISGTISATLMFLTLPFMESGAVNSKNGETIGYTAIFLSFLLVFFGIRSYRENKGGGTITFVRAFSVGILITLISCLFYVGSWEIIYFKVMPDFGDKYAARVIAEARQSGASDAAIAAKTKEMESLKAMFKNPVTNSAMAFMEPFPVGLVITLVSAAILRRRTPALTPGVAQAA